MCERRRQRYTLPPPPLSSRRNVRRNGAWSTRCSLCFRGLYAPFGFFFRPVGLLFRVPPDEPTLILRRPSRSLTAVGRGRIMWRPFRCTAHDPLDDHTLLKSYVRRRAHSQWNLAPTERVVDVSTRVRAVSVWRQTANIP